MNNFQKNLNYAFDNSGLETKNLFATEVDLHRSTMSRLMNGSRVPNRRHLNKIANGLGIEPQDLLLDHKKFANMYSQKMNLKQTGLYILKSMSVNFAKCKDCFGTYQGQYIIYTSTKDTYVIASILELIRVTKNGIEFKMINPYLGLDKEYSAFYYRGYMLPIDDFLYFFGEQESKEYEVLTMIFNTSPLDKAQILEGIWTGIGVKKDRKFIASVPAIAVRQKRNHSFALKNLVNTNIIGHIEINSLPEMIKRMLCNNVIAIPS